MSAERPAAIPRELLASATPRPWKLYARGEDPLGIAADHGPGWVDWIFEEAKQREDDAALTVRAVNEYDAHLDVEEQVRRAVIAWRQGQSVDADMLSIEKHLAKLEAARADA